jgi:hypothetical protein
VQARRVFNNDIRKLQIDGSVLSHCRADVMMNNDSNTSAA